MHQGQMDKTQVIACVDVSGAQLHQLMSQHAQNTNGVYLKKHHFSYNFMP